MFVVQESQEAPVEVSEKVLYEKEHQTHDEVRGVLALVEVL